MYNIILDEVIDSVNYIVDEFNCEIPKVAIILGTGLGEFTKIVKITHTLKYNNIPNFLHGEVMGHKGNLSIATLENNQKVLLMEGRMHCYEGHSPQEVAFPIAILHALGVEQLIISNASGGINPNFAVGDLMLITDHLNFTGANPLVGRNNEKLGERFIDQTMPYSEYLQSIAKGVAQELDIELKEGVYIAVLGPTYETRAEIRAFALMGADAVGMSTIFEVIVANYFKMKVLAIATITNMATGLAQSKHNHLEVIKAASKISHNFSKLVKEIVLRL